MLKPLTLLIGMLVVGCTLQVPVHQAQDHPAHQIATTHHQRHNPGGGLGDGPGEPGIPDRPDPPHSGGGIGPHW